ncbi:M1 family aminopeptidase [Persicobacter psychrovividus]|uniref:Membrane protein n=1 Tax=Persicobacter psychrovividus TaxID=387638 RepID=A0ABN6L7T5_9BACT|nr:membrane protein [Persicobacter psychrovividus]
MFKLFFKQEVSAGLKRPMFYIFLFVYALIAFAAIATDSFAIGGATGENIYHNAPHIVVTISMICALINIIVCASYANNAALRDYENQFHEILFSTPINKRSYFWGRFLGAFTLAVLPLFGFFLGVVLSSIVSPVFGWVPADRIGPIPLVSFVYVLLMFFIPTCLMASSVTFTLSTRYKNTMTAFISIILLIVVNMLVDTLASDLNNTHLSDLLDIFGAAYHSGSKYFTPSDKNTIQFHLNQWIIYNRAIWLFVSGSIIGLGYQFFSFKNYSRGKKRLSKKQTVATNTTFRKPAIKLDFSSKNLWLQFRSTMRINVKMLIGSPMFLILLFLTVFILGFSLWQGFEYYGLQSYPLTYKMLEKISGILSMMFMLLTIFLSGELIHRDKAAHIHEVLSATRRNHIVDLAAKLTSILAMCAIIFFTQMAISIGYQLYHGFTQIKPLLYLQYFFLGRIPTAIFWVIVYMLIQRLITNKYLGYFISFLVISAVPLAMSFLKISTIMLDLGSIPGVFYSDISGYGPGMVTKLWMIAYWLLVAGMLFIVLCLFNVIPHGMTFKQRLIRAYQVFRKAYYQPFLICYGLFVVVAGWVFYNTQVINHYDSSKDAIEAQVHYEKAYKKYADYPKPMITDLTYHIDLFPHRRAVNITTDLRLENKGQSPIDTLMYTFNDDWNPVFDIPGAKQVLKDKDGFVMFRLDQPMLPGESKEIKISTNYAAKGFENAVSKLSILGNGTFFNNQEFLPIPGYADQVELQDKEKRKEHDLPERERTPVLDQQNLKARSKNYLSGNNSSWVNSETYISTSGDQTAIAPGSLVKSWKADGRNYYHYKVDHPSVNFASFLSARYEVKKELWKGISLEVYYHKGHGKNVDMMINALKNSIDYYSKNFAPYEHREARIIEFPRVSTFAQSFPGTMPYSESFGFVVNLENEGDNNIVEAVIAHEMAHQWWAHQEISAKMQGETMLTESFAEYSSLMVMKQHSDDNKMKSFLKYNKDQYLSGRALESKKEVPLYKVENQPYIHYRKGSMILFALQDYIGEQQVNRALHNFLLNYRYKEPPYPTSLDFLDELDKVVPDSLKYMVEDGFKKITLYDFRMKDAQVKKLPSGKYLVQMKIVAKKTYADSLGFDTPTPINDYIDVGCYSDTKGENLFHTERLKINQEQSELKMRVDKLPKKVEIDPRHLMIEKDVTDNSKTVSIP